MLPESLHSQRRSPLLIRLNSHQVCFLSRAQDKEQTLAQFSLNHEGAQQREAFFTQNPQWQRAEKILLLGPKQALMRQLTLPIATQENLTQVIAYEIDRYLPYKTEEIYFLARLLGKNKEATLLNVELVCSPKDRLHQYCKTLQNWGQPLDAAIFDHGPQIAIQNGDYSYSHNLLPPALRRQKPKAPAILINTLAAALLLLTLLTGALPLWLQANTLSDLQQKVQVAKQQAEEVDALKSDADAMLAIADKISILKQQAPSVLNILQQLSELLPKDTWLKNFEFSGNKVSLQGLTASTAALIGLLEASPYFQQTSFTSPVTQDSQAGLDRFQLDTLIEANH